MNPVKLLIDVIGGAALVFVLLLVLIVDLLTRSPSAPVAKNDLKVNLVSNLRQAGSDKKKLRLLVLTDPVDSKNPITQQPEVQIWDDMAKLLVKLGAGYQHEVIQTKDLLAKPDRLKDCDVLFFTCAPKGEELADTLAKYVSDGGVLYASDWRYDAVAKAFPEMVDLSRKGEGMKGLVKAEVVDPGLRDVLGTGTVELNFDLTQWKTAAFGGPRVTVLMQGHYRKIDPSNLIKGVDATAPLLVKFPFGKGQVIFTSFHNEKVSSAVEDKLLQYLVFAMVTANVDAELQEQVNQGGFAPQRSNLLSTPKENPSVTKSFQNHKVGPLRVALGFRDEGAKLKLYLRSPDGRDWSQEFTSGVVLEVPDAAVGEWSYTITAVQLPYENFPFIVTIGEKK
jgi:hypothetical protein